MMKNIWQRKKPLPSRNNNPQFSPMKHTTNDLLRSAIKKVNETAKQFGMLGFDWKKIRADWSPSQNLSALRRFREQGIFQFSNDVNSGLYTDGTMTKYGDAAIAQYLLVQKGASAPTTNVAVFTSGLPLGTTTYGGITSTTQPGTIKLLCGSQGNSIMTSDGTAAVLVGDIIVGVSGGKVKTNTATGTVITIVGFAIEPVSNGATSTDAEFQVMPTLTYKSV